jgi:hypothetical protein
MKITPLVLPMSEKEQTRFWSKVDRRGPDECWPWRACILRSGYGYFTQERTRKGLRAHRVALMLSLGRDIGNLLACHTCDNRRCCNPAHLWPGTSSENRLDASAKGRLPAQRARPKNRNTKQVEAYQ